MKKSAVYLLIIFMLTGCSFIGNTFKYKKLCNETVDNILAEDYPAVVSAFSFDQTDTVQLGKLTDGIKNFRQLIIENFGTEIDQRFMTTEKKFSTEGNEPNITTVYFQIENEKEYGTLKFTIDDTTGKIQWINLGDTKNVIPDTTWFWLFGIFPLGVLLFNIYTVWRISKSDFPYKWILILMCIGLNIPSMNCYIDYPQLKFQADLSLQMMLGVSFNLTGYDNYLLEFGFPLGSIITQSLLFWDKRKKESQKITFE
jgi:hypothetical protein